MKLHWWRWKRFRCCYIEYYTLAWTLSLPCLVILPIYASLAHHDAFFQIHARDYYYIFGLIIAKHYDYGRRLGFSQKWSFLSRAAAILIPRAATPRRAGHAHFSRARTPKAGRLIQWWAWWIYYTFTRAIFHDASATPAVLPKSAPQHQFVERREKLPRRRPTQKEAMETISVIPRHTLVINTGESYSDFIERDADTAPACFSLMTLMEHCGAKKMMATYALYALDSQHW